MDGRRKPGSHIKIFLPYLPYLAISHSVNSGFVRPADNERGWEYDLAVSHTKISDKVYEFELRKGVRFHDGSPFNADAVLLNMQYFKKKPYTYTSIDQVFDRTEKMSEYRVRIHLKKKYGLFMYDAMWIHFYTQDYLEKYGWNGKPTAPNLAAPGLYSIGPYILKKGYVEGDRNSSVVELVANKDYWDPRFPKVDKITIYLDLQTESAVSDILSREGALDVMPIPFSYELPTVLSKFGKLVRSPSTNNYSVHINMINGNPLLQEREVREALNRAIDQESLLMLSMNGEGEYSPTMVSPNFYGVRKASNNLQSHSLIESPLSPKVRSDLIATIKKHQVRYGMNPDEKLKLKFLVQESFLYLIGDIKYFLELIHIDLQVEVVGEEKNIFDQLLNTRDGLNTTSYDLLIWANYDWIRHPWTALFVYRPSSVWSTIGRDTYLEETLSLLQQTDIKDLEYVPLLKSIIQYVYRQSYMLFLPSPNKVLAFNKEVSYKPRPSAFIPLWEIEVSDNHWSVRDGPYPAHLKNPVEITHH
ncbi:MAG TPA: ABC transporter substrate-binding protein [Porticoccus sp.]|nr:ABC transporter substrate-binding protein [Porticoccus sp.]